MVIDLAECRVHDTDSPGPPVRGSLRFDAYMIQPDNTIAFSATHSTIKADRTVVSEFMSYRVHPMGKVDVRTIVLDPVTDATIRDSEFDCDIGKGAVFPW